jgi:DNA mismatch repair protein MutL
VTPRIRQLPAHVVTQIAAGEVIERPASVVKELVENALDAGASRIDVELEQGGTELIRVTDDGCGINADDLPLAFAPHATSKLRDADDLFRIGTMGFRGEALASVGGVARVTLQSRPPGEPVGAEVRCDGGALSAVKPWGGGGGTRVEVRHLFYNIPARKKFLKSLATEHSHACEAVTRLALAHPGVHFTLRHNGKSTFELPASAGLPDRVALFFGGDVRDALYAIDTGPGPHRLTGFVADPACDRGNAKLQYFFVNGRWFRDRTLGFALQEAYRGLLMTGRYPVGFLFLELPTDQVDVNVHPAKAEVRFRDNGFVFSLVRAAVKNRLLRENLVPRLEVPASEEQRSEVRGQRSEPEPGPLFSPRREAAERAVAPWEDRGSVLAGGGRQPPVPAPVPERVTEQEADAPRPPEPPPAPTPSEDAPLRVAANPPPFELPSLPAGAALQVHDAYLVLETPAGMLVIDQHALHERILYEQLRRRVREGRLEVQRLLIPEPIDLPADQAACVLDARDALAELGLDVTEFGGNTVLLSSYPTLLGRRSPHEIFRAAVDYLVTNDRPPAKEVLLDHLLATMACKAAVKAGDRLTQEEIAHLLHLRQLAEDSHHCPHGRPTSLLFSRQDLDRQFRRV